MANVPAPVFFLAVPGESRVRWEDWKEGFSKYALAVFGANYSNERKEAFLFHCLGTAGQEVLKRLPEPSDILDAGPYERTLAKLDRHFRVEENIILERYKFATREQKNGESIEDFVTALRGLAVKCKFTHCQDEHLRDQLMIKCSNDSIRKELWKERNSTLDRAIEIAKMVEHTDKCIEVLQLDTVNNGKPKLDESQGSVLKVSKVVQRQSTWNPRRASQNAKRSEENRPATGRGWRQRVPAKDSRGIPKDMNSFKMVRDSGQSRGFPGRRCFRCGSLSHIASDKDCFAIHIICNECGVRGHIARCCRNFNAGSNQVHEISASYEDESYCEDGREVVFTVNAVNGRVKMQKPYAEVVIRGVPVRMLMDSGADYTLISVEVWRNKFDSCTLWENTVKANAYGDVPIDIIGCFDAELQFKDRKAKGCVYVTNRGGELLSWSDQAELKIRLEASHPEQVMSVAGGEPTEIQTTLSGKLGCLKGFVHVIRLKKGAVPKIAKLRTIPLALRGDVEEELKRMERDGVIEKIEASEWVSPIVVVRKGNGSLRLCIDLRHLNSMVVADRFPLPRIDDLMVGVAGSKVFSILDLKSAYHQVELHPNSRDLTAFITPIGLFRCVRMPFGLVSAASVFQSIMHKLLGGEKGVMCYQDDVLVCGSDEKEHDVRLKRVLDILKEAGLTVALEKCTFKANKVVYLGHEITGEGVRPKEEAIEAIKRMEEPKSKGDVLSFLGLVEFYGKFVKGLAEMSRNMRFLTRKGVVFKWCDRCKKEFLMIKEAIVNAPILKIFDESKPTLLFVDASDYGVGAVLMQEDQTGLQTVAFASRSLKGPESRYSVIEKEALACVWGVDKFKRFLWGRSFTICTDHKPLVGIFTKGGLEGVSRRIMKWVTALQGLQYTMLHVKGEVNVVADALSRSVQREISDDSDFTISEESAEIFQVHETLKKSEWDVSCTEDVVYQGVLTLVAEGKIKSHRGEMNGFAKVREELWIQDGYLYKGHQMVVPVGMRKSVLELAHVGHLGLARTKGLVRSEFWWPGIDKDIEEQVKDCVECIEGNKGLKVQKVPMVVRESPRVPWDEIALDLLGPFNIGGGRDSYLLVVMDLLSKWPEVCVLKDISSSSIIRFLEQLFWREGFPRKCLSDNGTQLVSREFKEFLENHGIEQVNTSLYHPQSNGCVERFNRTLMEAIRIAVATGGDWVRTVMERKSSIG
ncbi:exosome complex component RRP42 isoform X1 [Ambystoma mexicanum]|uniref:exosome complex component RRP42 isoform X1 n=1 Tax=Ambystoma mexicanum TaxID=8296 RepID=UPI0037E86076